MGETISFRSSVDPVLLAQDSFTSSATSPADAPRVSGYPPGMPTGSAADRYNEGFIAGALYREAQKQVRIGCFPECSRKLAPPSNTTDTESTPSVVQFNKSSQITGNSPKPGGGPKEWAFINLGPADFEDPQKVGKYFAQTIAPSLKAGSSHRNQYYPSTGAVDARRLPKVAGRLQFGVPESSEPAPDRTGNTGSTLEGRMPQSCGSATYGAPIPSYYQGFEIPQAPSVAPDIGQYHVSSAQSSNEIQNQTESYQNWGDAALSANDSSDNNAPGIGASFIRSELTQTCVEVAQNYNANNSISSGRDDPINSSNQPEIFITAPPAVSEPSHGALSASFPQRAQQDVGQFIAPPQQPEDLLNNMDFSFIADSIQPTCPPYTDYRELQQKSLELQFSETVSIHDQFASQTSTKTPESGSAHMCQRIIGTASPQVRQQGSGQLPASPHTGRRSQMNSENSMPSSTPVIERTDSQTFGDGWSENSVQPAGAQIGTTDTDLASVQPGDFSQIQADGQSDYGSALQASQFTLKQAINSQAQVFTADVADQMQPYTTSTSLAPSGSILQSTAAATCLNRGFSSTNNELSEQSLPTATPAVTQEHSIAAPLPLALAQHDTNTNLPALLRALLGSPPENQPGSGANNQGFLVPVQRQDRLLIGPPFSLLPYDMPTEPLRRNRYVPDEVIYDTRGVSAANNRAQVSGRIGVNPTQAGTPVVAQPGGQSSVQAPVNRMKRQRKRVSNSSASKPTAKKARLTTPETQVGSPRTGARKVVDTRVGNNSASAGSSSSTPTKGNTNYPRSGYIPVDSPRGPQHHQLAGRPSASPNPPSPIGAATEPQNRAPIPEGAYFLGQPNREILEQMLKQLPAMVAKQDAILEKFEEYKQVYGPSLYHFYMGDRTSNPRAELRIPVTDEDDADMQNQGNDLLQVTQDISNTLLQVIMNMTDEQSAPNFLSLMYFSNSAGLRNALPVVDRVANTRLMANLILGEGEEARLKALAR